MGVMKRLVQELADERMLARNRELASRGLASLDFDETTEIDTEWWREQDTELVREELESLEEQALVFEERRGR